MAEYKTYDLAQFGEPLFTSRSSEVYAFPFGAEFGAPADAEVLLKLFRPDVEQEYIDSEEVNTKEIFAKGATAVDCYGQVRVQDGDALRSGILIKKIPGQTLIAFALTKPWIIPGAGKLMAEKQLELHACESDVIWSYKDLVRQSMDKPNMDFLSKKDRKKVLKYLDTLPDKKNILHFDYHPDNIMSDGENVSIIDFMTVATGDPAADVCATKILLNEGEMIPGFPKVVAMILNVLKKYVYKKYVKAYKELSGVTEKEIDAWRLAFLIVRKGIWAIPSESEPFKKKIQKELKKL